ncbi:MAG: hypothetical protein M1819_000723 [Sarea resinae]|nr:MAG: hypothetical protein M1819_000723 [Sarea resinae]
MSDPSKQLQDDLSASVIRALESKRPLLTHLNADTTWLLQIPYPAGSSPSIHRRYFNVLIDPWLVGPQSDVARWFSQQWHSTDSSVKSIKEIEELVREVALLAEKTSTKPQIRKRRKHSPADKQSLIDAVVISHEFTDHCHKDTLMEIDQDVPVFATTKAADLIRSWKHFSTVQDTPSFTGGDWRDTSLKPLPNWIGIARLTSNSDALYYHSAILITFDSDAATGLPKKRRPTAEAIIYTPHGINAEDIRVIPAADPPIRTVAFLHGLHDVSIGRQQQLNLGAHNGLKAQRLLEAKYWVGTHDEIKQGGGIISFFLRRRVLTLQEALENEKGENDGLVADTSDLADIKDVRFAELGNGESLVLE